MPNTHLDQNFIEDQKERLLDKRQRLYEELSDLDKQDPYLQEGRDTDNAEVVDEAILEDYAKVQIEAKKANINKMLAQINKALDRMQSGEYGICEITGDEIDKARLLAYPEATTTLEAEEESAQA